MSNWLLQNKINTLDKNIANGIKSLQRTLVMDSWSNKKHKYLVVAMLLIEGNLYFTIVYDNLSVKKIAILRSTNSLMRSNN